MPRVVYDPFKSGAEACVYVTARIPRGGVVRHDAFSDVNRLLGWQRPHGAESTCKEGSRIARVENRERPFTGRKSKRPGGDLLAGAGTVSPMKSTSQIEAVGVLGIGPVPIWQGHACIDILKRAFEPAQILPVPR